mmetsp:Transcript_60675/g.112565  ORF Transcript_60675/g.112565 Transcript_60675/m.112565 type:complete len:342 (-) Transcript_60675:76-1101(-)
MIGDPVEYRGSGVAHIRLYGGMMVPKEPLGVPVRPHFRKTPDPDYEWYCHIKNQGPWAPWQKDVSPPFSHYPESSCVKKYFKPGDDHSRRVFAELAKQGHGFQDCTRVGADGVRSVGDERQQRTVRQRYSQIMKRPIFFAGMRPHSAPSTSRPHYYGQGSVPGTAGTTGKQRSSTPVGGRRPKPEPGMDVPKKTGNAQLDVAIEAANLSRHLSKKIAAATAAARSKKVAAADTDSVDATKLANAKALAAARKAGGDMSSPTIRRPASAPSGPRGARAVSLLNRRLPKQAAAELSATATAPYAPLESSRGSRSRKPKESSAANRSASAPGRTAASGSRNQER